MIKTTLKIDGMMCGMCEAHVNDAIRRIVPPKKLTSSHKAGETVIITDEELDEAKIRAAIEGGGYKILSYASEPYEKTGFFASLFKK